MISKVTFANCGGDTSIRPIPFKNLDKCKDFINAYNLLTVKSNVKQVMVLVYPVDSIEQKKTKFSTQDSSMLITLKVMYSTLDGYIYNVTIPYLPKTINDTEIKSLMMNIENFKGIVDIIEEKTISG